MLTLVIGDKNLSSWSLRPWILLKHVARHFDEVRLPLDTPRFHEQIGQYSPSGRVPVLLDGTTRIWDSLAICEYVNELDGGKAWPDDAAKDTHSLYIQDAGPLTKDYRPLPGCPAIDAGLDLSTAYHGKPLPGCEGRYFKGQAPDIGAFEAE